MVGHTHEDEDQFFSRIRESILKHNVCTLDGNVYALFTIFEVHIASCKAKFYFWPPYQDFEKASVQKPQIMLIVIQIIIMILFV